MAKSRILVLDDHPIVREGLAELVNRQADLECCGSAGSVNDGQRAIATLNPDLVLLDLRLGAVDGLEFIKSLKAQFPSLRLLVVSQLDEGTYAERALRAGALGYVMKEQATDDVLTAIRQVLAGKLYVSDAISNLALHRMLDEKPPARVANLESLTDRELYVFKSVGAGKSNKEIAGELSLSVKTIETYREHIKHKLGLGSGAELVKFAQESALRGGAGDAKG